MLDLQHREKLVEAISFFAGHTRNCGLVKLFKLLYWLDYHNFRETGETVTGLTYQAFPKGPVPESLYNELQRGSGEVAAQFTIKDHERISAEQAPTRTIDDDDDQYAAKQYGLKAAYNRPTQITPRKSYRHQFLTRREQRIADWLAEIFRDATAAQISDVSHQRFGPWHQAMKERGERVDIDFMGKLFPIGNGNYLDDEELKKRVAEFKSDLEHFA